MKISDWLARYVEVAPYPMNLAYTPRRCLNATRVTIEVARNFGFKARPLSVSASVANETAIIEIDTTGPPTSDAWAGHLVALVENEWLVDAAATQFRREARNLLVPDVLVAKMRGREATAVLSSCTATYRVRRNFDFLKYPGYQPHDLNMRVANEIVALMRQDLDPAARHHLKDTSWDTQPRS